MNKEIKGRDIVIVGQQPWDVEIGSNCKNIAVELSKFNRVLYVNQALDRITSLKNGNDPKILKRKGVIRGKENGLIPISDNLWNLFPDVLVESINWIDSAFIFDVLNRRNNKLLAGSILKAMKTLNFRDIILFNDNDMFRSFHLKEFLQSKLSIYYSRDYMLAVDYWKKHGERIEPLLIAKSDMCVANSTYLTDYCKQYNAKSFYIGQGCEIDMFSNLDKDDIAEEIINIPGSKIGYVGALQSIRLDIELIAFIANSNPNWSVILVGPEDEVFKTSVLHDIPNIYFVGSKSPESLPRYINSFNVCINPQLINQVTIGNYPRKIDEYLAVGLPVVATLTEAASIFKDCIYLSENKEEFVSLIEKAMSEDSMERVAYRKKVAASHSWENSVNELYKAMNEVTFNE
uniref:glycosyltransferase n=1 Tax=Pedobacter schmidteae TaxID=2201271 RepID=UPI000EB35288|nr:glycosyltransferase [Pedobacter schmidteae]